MPRHLIVTNSTAPIDGIVHEAMRVARTDVAAEFPVIVTANPVSHGLVWTEGESRACARQKAQELRDRLRRAGLRVPSAAAGDASAVGAINDALIAGQRFDALIIAAKGNGLTNRFRLDVWSRAARRFAVPVTAVAPPGAPDQSGSYRRITTTRAVQHNS